MSDKRKVFRTAAYKVPRDGEDHVMFWSLQPYLWDDTKSFVTEHDLYAKGSTSKPVTEAMPEHEALNAIREIERGAAGKYGLADESYKDHKWIGDTYREAPHVSVHPRYTEGEDLMKQRLDHLRSRKKPGLSLK